MYSTLFFPLPVWVPSTIQTTFLSAILEASHFSFLLVHTQKDSVSISNMVVCACLALSLVAAQCEVRWPFRVLCAVVGSKLISVVSSSSAVTFISPYFSRVIRADDPHRLSPTLSAAVNRVRESPQRALPSVVLGPATTPAPPGSGVCA